MSLSWSDDLATVDWHELEALYHAAPLGSKQAGELADGVDYSYICDVAVVPSHQSTRTR